MREKIISLRARESTITISGVLVGDNGLQWIIEEVDDDFRRKYPKGQRWLHMSKNGWVEYALLDREEQL